MLSPSLSLAATATPRGPCAENGRCKTLLELEDVRWGTGLCDACYDASKAAASKRDAVGATPRLLSAGVQAH